MGTEYSQVYAIFASELLFLEVSKETSSYPLIHFPLQNNNSNVVPTVMTKLCLPID